MVDQAESLRKLAIEVAARDPSHEQGGVIGVLGAQPTVGTTTVTVNLAIALARQGWPVSLIDADFDRPSVDRKCRITPRGSWQDFLAGKKTIRETLQPGPAGLNVFTGIEIDEHDTPLRTHAGRKLMEQLPSLAESRLVVADLGRGWSEADLYSVIDDVIVVTTPQAECVMQAYLTMKLTAARPTKAGFWLVANRAVKAAEAKQAQQRVTLSCDRFLNLSVQTPNPLPHDVGALEAERAQRPLILHAPSAPLSLAIDEMATAYTGVRRAFGRATPSGV